MSSRNRKAGHGWEREVVSDISEQLDMVKYDGKNEDQAEVGTARAFSRTLDNLGSDVWFKDLNIHLQCKSKTSKPNYHDLLSNYPDDRICAILHKYTKKRGSRFMTQGKYAILRYEDFIKILKIIYEQDRELLQDRQSKSISD